MFKVKKFKLGRERPLLRKILNYGIKDGTEEPPNLSNILLSIILSNNYNIWKVNNSPRFLNPWDKRGLKFPTAIS